MYGLLVIPILGFLGGVAVFIIRRFKDRLLFILLDRIFDCLGSDEGNESHMAETDSTAVESTCPKERFVNLKFSSDELSSTYPETSVSGDTWNDRIQTDARKIFENIGEERIITTDLSSSIVEVLDKATQVSDTKSTDFEIEMDDLSVLRSVDVSNESDQVSDLQETSFIETRSGRRYKKVFILKK